MREQRGVTVWFTGLSGSGKTTVAKEVERILLERGLYVQRLDGDVVRESLTRDLGFTREDRDRNIERISFVARLLTRHDVITLCSLISPYQQERDYARRQLAGVGGFIEVYVNAPLEVCEARDVKGLYQLAREGKIEHFTGINDPYEVPGNCDLELHTDREAVGESAARVVDYLQEQGYIPRADEGELREGRLQEPGCL